MEAVFANEENTQISWTNDQGQVWSVPYPLADGQIPNQVQEWLDAGNTISPYVAPPSPPVTQVTAYQAKIQLSRSGLYDSVVTTVNTSDNPELKIAWEVATTFERNSLFILALQPELGLTDAQVDDLFQQASQIS
jgi:DNA-binding XRE family transcriptional regulator